jgi:hypothetical protein
MQDSIIMRLLILSVLFISFASAAAIDSSSCSIADIEAAITKLGSAGGTVRLPACDFSKSCEKGSCWTGTLEIDRDTPEIRILGQGINSTRIRFNGAAVFSRGKALRELGGIFFDGNGGQGELFFACHACENLLIHDIVTNDLYGSTGELCGSKSVVIYNCTFGRILYGGRDHWYIFGDNNYDADWRQGFGSADYNVFFEDNIFHESHHPVSIFTAGKAVIRHNVFDYSINTDDYDNVIDAHSASYGDCDGDWEPYNWDPWDTYIDGTKPEERSRGGRAY